MNRAEAGVVLGELALAYRVQPSEQEAEVWYQTALERVEFEVGRQTAARITESDEHWPRPARFNEVRRAIEADAAPIHQLEAGPITDEQRANIVRFQAKCREILAARDKRNHWHGGPNPCEVCGGIDPNLGAKKKRAARIRAQADTLRKMHTGRDRKPYDSPAPWNEQELTPLRDDTVVVQKDQS